MHEKCQAAYIINAKTPTVVETGSQVLDDNGEDTYKSQFLGELTRNEEAENTTKIGTKLLRKTTTLIKSIERITITKTNTCIIHITKMQE